ncbi:MAG: PQQ-binding-like beta-propeller repeat protein [Lachnospiraceae bacterium]|jgi:hypothetical protein|nr:PQQ-binding-like beta-propeller repeat protein [Lachnospiraceae bacterium]
MWKLIVLLLLAAAAAFVGVSEHKRREKARARAKERREKRQASLAAAAESKRKAFKNEQDEDEQEDAELSFDQTEEKAPIEPAAEEKEMPAEESESLQEMEEKKPEAAAPARKRTGTIEESALDVLMNADEDGEKEEKPVKKIKVLAWAVGGVACIAVCALALVFLFKSGSSKPIVSANGEGTTSEISEAASGIVSNSFEDSDAEESTPPVPVFTHLNEEPHAVEQTQPAAWGMNWEILNGASEALESYQRPEAISFADPSAYFALPGIPTFRGNPYRNDASYGTASLTEKRFSEVVWSQGTGSIPTSDGTSSWTGSGWTGQPLIVEWDAQTRRNMNLYEDKKNQESLTEVIYATLDGTIYFMDLQDGSYTRDPLYIGMTFKGAGALDPRGYPLMYVGSGDYTVEGTAPKMFIISLIDGSILYTYGDYDPAALRSWCAFDSSPLVDAQTDTLIWPGENGILYTIKLNSVYDAEAGTMTIAPEQTVRTRYTSGRSGSGSYWLGYECSVSVIDHYAYLSENGGMFYCIDLNTMQLIWAQDTKDDSNSTPVAELDAATGRGYIYTAPSLHWTASDGYGSISIYKLDAVTGEVIWKNDYNCATVDGVSGGVQATPVLGRKGSDIENLIIYPIARTPDVWSGVLVALDKNTGNEAWRLNMDYYAWSSPVAVYNEEGKGCLVLFDSEGNGFLLEGTTGRILDQINVGSLVEASPAVYGNRLIVGTRGQRICAVDLK